MGAYVIAEAGVNHNGDPEIAHRLIDASVSIGADAIKFQTFSADALSTQEAPKAAYQMSSTDAGQSQLNMLRQLELSRADYYKLAAHAREAGIDFLSTPFDRDSLAFLVDELDVVTLKIGSGDMTDGPLLLDAARTGRNLIISTGMSTMVEVMDALDIIAFGRVYDTAPVGRDAFHGFHKKPEAHTGLGDTVTLLHCTSLYPARADQVNLRAMISMGEQFDLLVGYSDHTEGSAVALAAVALGATMIEKHLTLDRGMTGPDHSASMEPQEFGDMITSIRLVEAAMGFAEKAPVNAEMDTRRAARKSLVAAQDLQANALLSVEDLAAKRPGDGISPIFYWDFLNTPAVRDFKMNEKIER